MKDIPNEQCFRFFSEIIYLLKSTNQHEQVLHLVVDRLFRIYKCQTCAVVLIDPKTEYLRIDNCCGLSLTFCNAFRRRIATASIGSLLWTGKPIVINDAEQQAELAAEVRLENVFASCACVQISVDHRTLGYLHIDSKDKNVFGDVDLELLRMFADVAGLALVKSQLYEDNIRLDRVDHETGLDKYVPFLEKVRTSMARAKDFNEDFAVMILDIDNFKSVVNTYGYDASRQLLKEIGDVLGSHLRSIDAGGRYGFDEFILLLANTCIDDAIACAKRIRITVEGKSFTKENIRSSVSIGLAGYPQNGLTVDDIILTAKKALFEAQREGRNNVFSFRQEWYVKDQVPVHY